MMRLKLALVDNRTTYVKKLMPVLLSDYADQLEVFVFSTMESADEHLRASSVDIMLVSSDLADETLRGRKGAVLAYLVDDKSIESVYGHRAICRFQKVDLIYRSVLEACSDRFDHVRSKHVSDGANSIAFFPASGGAGASSMAAACAVGAAKRGLRPFYLNLELFGTSSTYFDAMGGGGLEDVLLAIEAKKGNVAVRLQSSVKRSGHGVYFLDSCNSSLDVAELSADHVRRLVREISQCGEYDVIVLDMDFAHSDLALAALDMSACSVFVSNGTPVSNGKFERLYRMLQALERRGDVRSLGGVMLAYNNFSSKTGKRLQGNVVPVAGGLPRVICDTPRTLIEALATQPLFDELLAAARRVAS